MVGPFIPGGVTPALCASGSQLSGDEAHLEAASGSLGRLGRSVPDKPEGTGRNRNPLESEGFVVDFYSPVKRNSACQGPSEWTTSQ